MQINRYVVLLAILDTALLVYGFWRLHRLRGAGERPRPAFASFWLWPFAWIGLVQLFPGWHVSAAQFEASRGLILIVAALDFIHDYGLRAGVSRGQWRSCLLVVPLLLWQFRSHLSPAPPPPLLNLPIHGKAMVWTDSMLEPRVYYFIRTERAEKSSALAEDPNQGRPVFAPAAGTVAAVEGQTLVLAVAGRTIRLSPLLADSLLVEPGAPVFANQPLGIMGASDSMPGLRMALDGPFAFGDVMSGRLLSQVFAETRLGRNQYVASAAASRWRVE